LADTSWPVNVFRAEWLISALRIAGAAFAFCGIKRCARPASLGNIMLIGTAASACSFLEIVFAYMIFKGLNVNLLGTLAGAAHLVFVLCITLPSGPSAMLPNPE
jgi:hypothetical protein